MKTPRKLGSNRSTRWASPGVSIHVLTLVVSLLLPTEVSAQTPAAGAGGPAKKDDAVVMSPFDVKSTRDSGYQATESKTATGIALELAKIPVNIQVITSQFVEDLAFVSMHETLRYTSGLVIDEFNRDASGVRIRGFQNDNFYRNGIPRRQGVYMDNLERLEVVKGPVTAFFAESNPGGIVNYVTKVPEFINRSTLKGTFGSFAYKYFSFDNQGVMPGYDKLAYRVIATNQNSEDWKVYEYVKRWYISPELRWRPSKLIDFTLSYEWVQSRENLLNNGRTATKYHEDYAKPPADVINFNRTAARLTDAQVITFLQGRWLGPNLSTQGINNWQADVGAARGGVLPATVTTGDLSSFYPEGRRFNTGGPGAEKYYRTWQLEGDLKFHFTEWLDLRYNYNYYQGLTDVYAPFGFPNGDRTIPVQQRTSVLWNYNDVNSVDVFLKKEIAGIKHRFVFGGQVADSTTKTGTRRMDFTGLGPVTHGTTVLTGQAVANFYNPFTDPVIDVRRLLREVNPAIGINYLLTKSLYATYQGSAFKDRLSTLIGVRRDSNRNSPTGTVPTFGASYEFLPGFIGFASHSENFRINGPNITGAAALPSEISPNLAPETAVGTDIGIKTNWRDNKLSGSFTYYTLENNNERRTDRVRTDNDPRNLDNITSNNITWFNIGGRERNTGIELDGMWAPHPNYILTLGYSWVWFAKIVADPSLAPGTQAYRTQIGRRLGNDPRHQVKIWNKYRFTTGALKGWSIGAGVRYVGPTDAQFTQFIFDWKNPSYQIYDLLVAYTGKILDRPVNLSLIGQNMTEEIYQQGLNNQWGPPRKIFLTVKFDL